MALRGKTVFITGASRGIGAAIATKFASLGANIAVAAKTSQPHPKLPGTIHTTCSEVEKLGGKALPLVVDVRKENDVQSAVDETVKKFGGIDIVINNASAIMLTGTEATPMKSYDLMHQVNGRGTFLTTKCCAPHLLKSAKNGNNPHVLNISPPLDMQAKWFKNNCAYTAAKYNMSMFALGMSAEFKDDGIRVNCLWPRTAVATAAINMLMGQKGMSVSRKPEIMADAAAIIVQSNETGQFFIDDALLLKNGFSVEQINDYAVTPGATLAPDFFLDDVEPWLASLQKGQIPKAKL